MASNFFKDITSVIDSRCDEKPSISLSKSIRHWQKMLHILNQRYKNIADSIENKKKREDFEFAYALLHIHAFETCRHIESAATTLVAGYYGASLVLLRIAIERMLNGLYFTIDPSSLDDWCEGKIRLGITGKDGIIGRLNDEDFLRKKTGLMKIDRETILGKDISEYLAKLYRRYSKVVHGINMESSDILEAYVLAKGNEEKFAESIIKTEEKFIETLEREIKNHLDLLGLIYLIGATLLTKGRVIEEGYQEETLLSILRIFPNMHEFVTGYLKTASEKKGLSP